MFMTFRHQKFKYETGTVIGQITLKRKAEYISQICYF